MFVPVAVVLLAVASVVVVGLPLRFARQAERWAEARALSLASVVAQSVRAGVEFGDSEFVETRLAMLATSGDGRFATVYRHDRFPLASWGTAPRSLPVFEGSAGPATWRSGDLLLVRVPIRTRGGSEGALIAGFSLHGLHEGWRHERWFATGVSALLLALGVFGAWLHGTAVSRPLRDLTAAARHEDVRDVARAVSALADGRVYRRDERMILVSVVASMAGRIAQQLSDLESERLRALDAEREARRASAVKSRFLANMSHELRTPLNVIIGYVELIVEREQLVDEDREDLLRIVESARHLVAIINDILDIAKVEADRMELAADRFDLRDVLARVAAEIDPLARRGGNTLVAALGEPAPVPMESDAVRVRQCVINLLSNAAKFTSQGVITLSLDVYPTFVRIAVTDTGLGMTEDQLAQLFQPFAQVDPSTTRRHGGTGLGLALTQQLAQLMGGRVSVSSAAGVGSTFTLELPRTLRPCPDTTTELDTETSAPVSRLLPP